MKKTILNSWVAIVLGSVALFTTYSCTDDDLTSNSGGAAGRIDQNVDYLQTKVTADVPTAVLSSFDEKSMGGALVRRLSNTSNSITDDTKMILIKGEDIKGRPLTEWIEAARIYLKGGYIAVEKPHNVHLVEVAEQLADKMAAAEDELMLKNGISIIRAAGAAAAAKSDLTERFKARIANIESRAGTGGDDEEAVAEMVIFANNGYYQCAPMTTKNITIRTRDKSGKVTTKTETIEHEYTLYETGVQADGAAAWLNKRGGEASKSRTLVSRADGSDAINDLMSADEEYNYQGALRAFYGRYQSHTNAFSEIIRTWGVHNMETNKDYYFIDQKIVASAGGLYYGPNEENKYNEYNGAFDVDDKTYNLYYGAWYGGGDYSMNLSGAGSIQLENALPSSDNNEGAKTISVGSFESTTTTIGGTITPGFTMKNGATISASGSFSTGYTQGTIFMMSTAVPYKELTCQKNTDGNKVTWTYGCGPDMMEGDDNDHPLAPSVLTGDVDINNQICWSVGNPSGQYTLDINLQTWMSTLIAAEDFWSNPGDKKQVDAADDVKTLSYTLLTPNRSKQIWNMDVTFPEITQKGYDGVKPQLTAALLQQFPSVYQPELILADQTPESENTIKQIVQASKNQLLDKNSLQTLREYALTFKLSEFSIKWYCSSTEHNTYQITIKAKGDPDPGKEITPDPIDLSKLTSDYVAQDGDVLTGTLGGKYKISIANGATVTLKNVTINGTNDDACRWAGITCQGNNIIVLADKSKNVVKGFKSNQPGIYVPEGCKLIIQGNTGTLDASSNGEGCGIGGSNVMHAGNIEIWGGVITATGGAHSAGIGAGYGWNCGNILISGGTVTATGGAHSAGIGSGDSSDPDISYCGTITINGGTVNATGSGGGAGIGTGYYSHVGDITLSGGTITATCGDHSNTRGIGTGYIGKYTKITITKGVQSVTATGGIGGNSSCEGTVTIEEGANVIQK